MFADEIRRAIEASSRMKLPEVAAHLWRAYGEGQVTEEEAEQLSNLIDERRAVPAPAPARRKVGTRPRTPASIERRRRWAASGAMPTALAARFTIAEQAVLAVVAGETVKHGRCTLFIGHIAALAGVSETSVRNALREARQLGLVAVEVRRVTAWRNDANVITVTSAEWLTWLARGGRGGGRNSVRCTNTRTTSGSDRAAAATSERCRAGESRHRPASSSMASGMRRSGSPGHSDQNSLSGSGRERLAADGASQAKIRGVDYRCD